MLKKKHQERLKHVIKEWNSPTWGTVELSVFLSTDGLARVISSLMVIFSRLQLDDFGSEESRACGEGSFRNCKTVTWLTCQAVQVDLIWLLHPYSHIFQRRYCEMSHVSDIPLSTNGKLVKYNIGHGEKVLITFKLGHHKAEEIRLLVQVYQQLLVSGISTENSPKTIVIKRKICLDYANTVELRTSSNI